MTKPKKQNKRRKGQSDSKAKLDGSKPLSFFENMMFFIGFPKRPPSNVEVRCFKCKTKREIIDLGDDCFICKSCWDSNVPTVV